MNLTKGVASPLLRGQAQATYQMALQARAEGRHRAAEMLFEAAEAQETTAEAEAARVLVPGVRWREGWT